MMTSSMDYQYIPANATAHCDRRLRRSQLSLPLAFVIVAFMLTGCATPEQIKDEGTDVAAVSASPTPTPTPNPIQPVTNAVAATSPVPAITADPAKPNPTVAQLTAPATKPVPARVPQALPDNARVFPGTAQFVRPQPTTPPANKGPEEFTLNYEGLDIRAVVQSIMGDMLRESFTIHPQTAGSVTIRLSRPVPRSELMPILETMLRQNGQVMIREEGIYKIMPAGLATKGSLTPQVLTTPALLPNGYSVQIVQLRFAGVRDMARILEPYALEPQSSVRVDELRNLVILSGTQRELKHMLEVIEIFDVDYLAGYSIGLFPMQTDVKTLATDLDRIFGGVVGAPPGAGPAAAAAGGSPLAGIVRIVPIERLNALLIITTQPRYLDEAKKWIDRLDKGGGLIGGGRLHVYQVQNGRSDRLSQLLNEIYGNRSGGAVSGPTLAPGARPATTIQLGAGGGAGGQQGGNQGALGNFISNLFQSSGSAVSKDTRIIADDDNNSLLIWASPSDYETILGALRQLDVPRRQVLVEVLVAEVTLTDELKFGIEWFVNARNNTVGALRNVGGEGSILPRVLPQLPGLPAGTDPRGGGANPIVPATGGLQLINVLGNDIRAVLQALGQDGRARVESAPKLLVLDNAKGVVNVGTRISVDTGSTTSTGGSTVTSRQYIDTGVLLTVTPRINAGGRVTLEVNQEVSSAGATSGSNPPINTRKAQTTVNVGSGETMVLAGLIQSDRGSGTSGVPLLSKIPLIGGLFGAQTFRNNRTELVVLITPTVVSNSDEARTLTDELRKKLPALEHLIPKKTDTAATK